MNGKSEKERDRCERTEAVIGVGQGDVAEGRQTCQRHECDKEEALC